MNEATEEGAFSPTDEQEMFYGLSPEESGVSGKGLLSEDFPPGISYGGELAPPDESFATGMYGEPIFGLPKSPPVPAPGTYDPEEDRLHLIYLGGPSWGGLWNEDNDPLLQMTVNPAETKAAAANLLWISRQESEPVDTIAPVRPILQTVYSLARLGRQATDAELFESIAQEIQARIDDGDVGMDPASVAPDYNADGLAKIQASNQRFQNVVTGLRQQMAQPGYYVPPRSLSPDGLTLDQRQAQINRLQNPTEPPPPMFGLAGAFMPELALPNQSELDSLQRRQKQHQAAYDAWRQSLITPQNVRARAGQLLAQYAAAVDHAMLNHGFQSYAQGQGVTADPASPDYSNNPRVRPLAEQWLAAAPTGYEVGENRIVRFDRGAVGDPLESGAGMGGVAADFAGLPMLGSALKDTAEAVHELGDEYQDPRLSNDPWSKGAHLLGSLAGLLLPAAGVGRLARGMGAGTRLAQALETLSVAGLGSAQNGWSVYQEALNQGATPDEAHTAAKWGALVGLAYVIPVARWAHLLNDGGVMVRLLSRMLAEAFQAGASSGAVTVSNNEIARRIYDPERKTFDGVLPAVGFNLAVGTVLSLLTSAVARGRRVETPKEKSNEYNPEDGPARSMLLGAPGEEGVPPSDSEVHASIEKEAKLAFPAFERLGIPVVFREIGKEMPMAIHSLWSGEITLLIDLPKLAQNEQFVTKGNVKLGEFSKLAFGEELIHAAHTLNLRDEWMRGDRKRGFVGFVEERSARTRAEIQAKIESVPRRQREKLLAALHDGYHLYFSSSTRPRRENVRLETLLSDIQNLSPQDLSNFMSEFVRQIAQYRRHGKISEEIKVKVFEVLGQLSDWFKPAVERLKKTVPGAYRGEYGQSMKEQLDAINRTLDALDREMAPKSVFGPYTGATLGKSTSSDHRKTFLTAYPTLAEKVIVHHAVEQQVLEKFPGLITKSEMHSLENLRGIPRSRNGELHLRKIRNEWDRYLDDFLKNGTSPTREQILQKATDIDLRYGSEFLPLITK